MPKDFFRELIAHEIRFLFSERPYDRATLCSSLFNIKERNFTIGLLFKLCAAYILPTTTT